MALTRAQFEYELVPGIRTNIGLGYEDYPTNYTEIFEVMTSDRSFEEELKLVGIGYASNKPEGEAVSYDEQAGEAWKARYIHETYGNGFILTQEAIEDNLYDTLGSRYSKELGRSMKKTKETVHANVLNFAFNSGVVGGDGVSLCNASHPTQSGLLNSNVAAVGVDLTEAALENALIQIAQLKDERGMLIAANGKKLVLPVGLQFIAKRLLGSEYRPGTNDNDVNALKAMGMLSGGFTINRYLTDPDAWFILTDIPDGLKSFQRRKLTIDKSGDFDTGNVKFKVTERYAVGYTDPLSLYGSPGN